MTDLLQLYPARGGWKLIAPGQTVAAIAPGPIETAVVGLGDLMGENGKLEISLPTRLALFEVFSLPSTDADELAGMVELQLEKRLPYPLEETQYAFRVVDVKEGESQVLAAALHRPRLDALCAPLVSAGHYPEQVSLQTLRVGEAIGRDVAAVVWWEEETLLFGIYEFGAPLVVEPFASVDELGENSARLMLGANVAGGSVAPEVIWLAPEISTEEGEQLRQLFDARESRTLPALSSSRFPNLAPPQWAEARQRKARKGQLLQMAKVAGVAAIGVVAAGFGLLAWQNHRVRSMDAQLEALRPEMETLLVTQTRWNALAPAIDPSRSTVELLYRISEQLPSDKVSITSFMHTPGGFELEGEAPSASEAVAYAEKLKGAEALQRYTLETPPPVLLAGDRAQFKIIAK